MAAINDLIAQIENPELRVRIQVEVDRMNKQRKFGLVFEEHLPECVPLYGMPIKKGCKVALKTGKINEFYTVMQVEGDNVYCTDKKESQLINFLKQDIVCIAEFGEPIYPYLKQIDSIYNSDDKDLPTHALIQADNYHALQLLEYLYAGKVDCIYIDPPYNTGARDWKYNNDYVDSSDTYRHSKWLSMMKKRLLLAKKLLNPMCSMLMITIDDNELCSLRLLIDEIFSECSLQIVDMFINPKGKARNGKLSQVDEYLLLIYVGKAETIPENSANEGEEIRWPYLRRSDVESARGTKKGGTQQFYPIYVDPNTTQIVAIGEPLTPEQPLSDVKEIENTVPVFPIRDDGKHMNWGLVGSSLQYAIDNGCVRITKSKNKFQPYNFTYVTLPSIEKALKGEYHFSGFREDGSRIVILPNGTEHQKTTAWRETYYDANIYGTQLIGSMLGEKRFSFPKSIYSVLDALSIYLKNKPNSLIIDFFAGSGTTLHAVNLLNALDNGKRQCVLVTNNEVSKDEHDKLLEKGLNPSDTEWDKYGIAKYVTWPRTKCCILGKNIHGDSLEGNYGVFHEEFESTKITTIDENGKMKSKILYQKNKVSVYPGLENINYSDGFKANAVFFKLGFLDKTSVQLGRQFKELIPLLWLKAGGWGKCPDIEELVKDNVLPPYIILPENRFAVLIDEKFFAEFEPKVNGQNDIWTVYIVTDFEKGFKSMTSELKAEKTYQLYRDYLDNFRINVER